MSGLGARIRRIEDRTAIVECVIRYAVSVDRSDWEGFADCFADRVVTDFGGSDAEIGRHELTAYVRAALDGFTLTQHLSTNHLVEFDETDPDVAVCWSAMYAQHHLAGSDNGEYYLLRAEYREVMRRTDRGWRIAGMSRTRAWEEGNLNAVDEARARVKQEG